ncbi:MAG TPA: slipin family protein [Euryarchaeota archaeon]|nr:slipin family protein [Euryarchaeota archaeon]
MDQLTMKTIVFSIILLLAVVSVVAIAYSIVNEQYVFLILSLAILLLLYLSLKYDILLQLKEYERAVVFRFGHYCGTRGPGWTIILPFIESYVKVDLRTQTLDVLPQKVITKDNIEVKVDAIIYYKVVDAAKAVINVEDYKKAAILYVEASLREIAGRMTAEEIISNVNAINEELKKELQNVAKKWGVEIVSVELKHVELPPDLMEAMHRRREAEQRKYAAMHEAEAEKLRIEAVKAAAEGLSDRALAYYYLQALRQIASGKATKIVLPLEVSTLAQRISAALGGAVSPEKVEKDLEGKYAYLLDEFKRMLEEKKSSGKENG